MIENSNNIEYSKKALPPILGKIGFTLLAVGLVLAVVAYFTDHTRAAYNNLIMLMFVTSIGLGSLFLIAVEYLMDVVWSVPFRRVFEFLGSLLIIAPIIAIPVYLNMHDMYHWTHHEAVEADALLKGKEPYLNMTFFTARIAVFFLIWIVFYLFFYRNSQKQDTTKDQKLTSINIKAGAVFMPFFAISLTFAAIDWMMSLEPHWFSTIYGVYYFAGTILAALAAGTFLIVYLNEKGLFIKGLVKDHYYTLGALLFAFTNFWAYIAFSQYMLYWYANIPEETFWFLQRWEGTWQIASIILILVRFLVPYVVLLSQPSKMNPGKLKAMSIWILVAHLVDLYWLIMPTYSKDGAVFGWMELAFPILGVGIVLVVFTLRSKGQNMVPIGDPKLKRGLNFRL